VGLNFEKEIERMITLKLKKRSYSTNYDKIIAEELDKSG